MPFPASALCAGHQDGAQAAFYPRPPPRRVGTLAAVQQVLAPCGWQINTAFVERVNLTIRQHVAAVGRRVLTLCKGEDGLRQQVALFHIYYNFCLPHTSLRLPFHSPNRRRTGSAKVATAHPSDGGGADGSRLDIERGIAVRVPPWPQPAGV